jgi:hypothetical protein
VKRYWEFVWVRNASVFCFNLDVFRDGFALSVTLCGRGFWWDTWRDA